MSLLLSLPLSHSGPPRKPLPTWPGQTRVPPQPHLPALPCAPSLSMAPPHLAPQPPEKPQGRGGRENGDVPMPGTTKAANEEGEENGDLCPGKHPSDLVSGWLPTNVRRPSGLQTFNAPGLSHHQFLKPSGRRPGPLQQIPERVSTCSAPAGQAHPCRPQPGWDEEAPALGRGPISRSQSAHPRNGQSDTLSLPDWSPGHAEVSRAEGGAPGKALPSAEAGRRHSV